MARQLGETAPAVGHSSACRAIAITATLSTMGHGQIIDIDQAPTAGLDPPSGRDATPGLSGAYDGVCVSRDGAVIYVVKNSRVCGAL